MSTADAPKQLQETLAAANLHILNSRAQLKSHQFDGLDDCSLGEDALSDPAVVASDVAAQISFLRKLKFQYLEQNAKDKYVKTIVSDDAPLITASSNEEIRLRNEEKKRVLKEAKIMLSGRQEDVRTLAPLIEEGDYQKARSLTTLATTLSAQILDARLALTRLRQAHPHPRLTVPSATFTLDGQVEQMQKMEDKLQGLNNRMRGAKEQLKTQMAELERLRSIERERVAELGLVGKESGEEEDPRVGNLYDWFLASLTIHRSLLSLKSSHAESENELRLTYSIDPAPSSSPKDLILTLLFIPNTRQLASVEVSLGGVELDLGDVIDAHVQANDVSGLVWAVVARARAESSGRKRDGDQT
ncbi:hypothetical protein PAXRUDRAFT_31920 [Paxillus rubicundulus Ve08.2h10]|uniref:Kinetochore protein Sos7 coiled-coil domain-containing protein n=1 Tax=Paxillus rubicundulus Ve08.2h10 TaxID=930991 RepID=A0A0D0DTH8_9AGAM|nr:hypothetical protein PAXRUDRAFT_31920 [Paxillus rubicundulus Ve08.2h10]